MIYVPRHFDEPRVADMHELITQSPFATLVSVHDADVQISHLPILLDTTRGSHGVLSGHLARANPHWQILGAGRHLAIFHGPHRYISPAWYQSHPSVPTWNYAVVHARGHCRIFEDRAWLLRFTTTLTARFEKENATAWQLPDDSDYLDKMCANIVGFELAIEDIKGKFKLSQNRPVADRLSVISAIERGADPLDRELIDLMRERA